VKKARGFGRAADRLSVQKSDILPNYGGDRIGMPIRVLLGDDTKIVRRAIARILESDPDIEIVGEATTLRETMELAIRLQPHVIVLDLHMGDENDVPLADLKTHFAGSQLLIVSIWNDDEAQALAKSYGAVAYLDKVELGTELIPAIKRCMRDRES
jgi:DNA-binding NarL/FixJ family response regulator